MTRVFATTTATTTTTMATTAAATAMFIMTASSALATQRSGSSQPTVSSDVVVIDGSKTPEQIPDYLLWEMGFRELSELKSRNMDIALATLVLSQRDHDFVFAAADAQRARDGACSAEQRNARAALGPDAKPAALDRALKEVVLRCRWRNLDARDELFSSLTDEGRAALTAWSENVRRTIKSYLSKSDLDFYRQPR